MNRMFYLVMILTLGGLAIAGGYAAPQAKAQETNQLDRFDNDWFVNGDRQHTYVVSRRAENSIELYTRSRGLCGVSQLSLKLTFDPATGKYYSRIKITDGNWDYNSHRRAKWLEPKLIGNWDAENNSMTWASDTLGSKESTLKVVAKFADSNSFELRIAGTGEFRHAHRRQNLNRIW